MGCRKKDCCHRKGQRVMMELMKSELVYDVANTTYTFADALSVDDAHEKHNIIDVAQDGNRDKLARILDEAVEDCRETLYSLGKGHVGGSWYETDEWEDCVGSPTNDEESYYLKMFAPRYFSTQSLHTMTVYAHNYIVNKAVFDWLMVVYPKGAEQFKVLAEDTKEKLLRSANRGSSQIRIKPHWI